MKNTVFQIILLLCLIGYSQNNVLSLKEFGNVNFNGVTLRDIAKTNADKDKLDSLFKQNGKLELNRSCPDPCIDYWNDDISFQFSDDDGKGKHFHLAGIRVESSNVRVQIKNEEIKIGDNYSELGKDVILTESENGMLQAFFQAEDLPAWYVIEIEKDKGTIVGIGYEELP